MVGGSADCFFEIFACIDIYICVCTCTYECSHLQMSIRFHAYIQIKAYTLLNAYQKYTSFSKFPVNFPRIFAKTLVDVMRL